MKRINITIREDQELWIKKNYLNVSRFVQDKIDELMKREKKHDAHNL